MPSPSDKEIKERKKFLRKKGADIDLSDNALAKSTMIPIEQAVRIVGYFTSAKRNETLPLLLPSKDALRAYDRIAKHIRDYTIL